MTEEEAYDYAISRPLEEKVERAIKFLKAYEPYALRANAEEGYYLAFSGGKDSIVVKELMKMAGVKFGSHYNKTTIDPPELVQYIKEHHKDVIWEWRNKYNVGFFEMVRRWGLPSGVGRWCCRLFKEGCGEDRVRVIGIRAEESSRRKKSWKEFQCTQGKVILAPICYWTKEDIWGFIRQRKIPYCKLYDEGFERVGCIGCPLQSIKKLNENFRRYPKWEKAYKLAAFKYFENRQKKIENGTYRGNPNKETAIKTKEEYWEFWRFQKGRKDFKQCVFEEMRREFPT